MKVTPIAAIYNSSGLLTSFKCVTGCDCEVVDGETRYKPCIAYYTLPEMVKHKAELDFLIGDTYSEHEDINIKIKGTVATVSSCKGMETALDNGTLLKQIVLDDGTELVVNCEGELYTLKPADTYEPANTDTTSTVKRVLDTADLDAISIKQEIPVGSKASIICPSFAHSVDIRSTDADNSTAEYASVTLGGNFSCSNLYMQGCHITADSVMPRTMFNTGVFGSLMLCDTKCDIDTLEGSAYYDLNNAIIDLSGGDIEYLTVRCGYNMTNIFAHLAKKMKTIIALPFARQNLITTFSEGTAIDKTSRMVVSFDNSCNTVSARAHFTDLDLLVTNTTGADNFTDILVAGDIMHITIDKVGDAESAPIKLRIIADTRNLPATLNVTVKTPIAELEIFTDTDSGVLVEGDNLVELLQYRDM